MPRADRILATAVSGPPGRLIALLADLGAALAGGARSRLGRTR